MRTSTKREAGDWILLGIVSSMILTVEAFALMTLMDIINDDWLRDMPNLGFTDSLWICVWLDLFISTVYGGAKLTRKL